MRQTRIRRLPVAPPTLSDAAAWAGGPATSAHDREREQPTELLVLHGVKD